MMLNTDQHNPSVREREAESHLRAAERLLPVQGAAQKEARVRCSLVGGLLKRIRTGRLPGEASCECCFEPGVAGFYVWTARLCSLRIFIRPLSWP
eukprot:4904212-Pleurochrysis_carterae.AAC.1